MLNSPVTSSVMKSGEEVWYIWVRSCGEYSWFHRAHTPVFGQATWSFIPQS